MLSYQRYPHGRVMEDGAHLLGVRIPFIQPMAWENCGGYWETVDESDF